MNNQPKTIVVALGGNALQRKGETDAKSQQVIAQETAQVLVALIKEGYTLAIVHGNGPQVGEIYINLNQQTGNSMPLDTCVAMSQGQIGYWLQQALDNELAAGGIQKAVVTMITQTVVDGNDPAFNNPTKPIGQFYDESTAHSFGFPVKEDAGRGWRRVVPSPKPLEFVEIAAIKTVLDSGSVVIASGGGGVPVIRKDNKLVGVEAVIDKDFSAAKLAEDIGASMLLILTAVDSISIDYQKPGEQELQNATTDELQRFIDQGQFAAGSMLPKVRAAIQFVKSKPGNQAIVTSPQQAHQALTGHAGTLITDIVPSY